MSRPRPGRMRYSATIESITGKQDATGQELKVWGIFTSAWISIEEPTGMERLVGQQIYAEAHVTVWGHYMDLIGTMPKMRVSISNNNSPETFRRFDIKAVSDPDGKCHWIKLECVERIESGSVGE